MTAISFQLRPMTAAVTKLPPETVETADTCSSNPFRSETSEDTHMEGRSPGRPPPGPKRDRIRRPSNLRPRPIQTRHRAAFANCSRIRTP